MKYIFLLVGAGWKSWPTGLNDIEPDRHRQGERASYRLMGSANYLYADGRAENFAAPELEAMLDGGVNPAIPSYK